MRTIDLSPGAPSRRRKATKRPTVREPLRWFPKNPEANRIADWLAFNAALDTVVGRTPCPDAWPYSEFKRPAVEGLLGRLRGDGPGSIPRIGCAP